MPGVELPEPEAASSPPEGELQFPPVTRDHILHCSYDYWFPKYRTSCIRSTIIPVNSDFLAYLRADGIMLADDENEDEDEDDNDNDNDNDNDTSDSNSDTEDEDDAPPPFHRQPPNRLFPALHTRINAAIAQLGGAAAPKLNWSAPKDATFISRHPNTMKCTTANDVYLLLKSSNFITHDLDHAFDGTTPTTSSTDTSTEDDDGKFTPVLVLRAFFTPLPSLEFRAFVGARTLLAVSQRDMAHYAFLAALRPQVVARVRELFEAKLRDTFPDESFVFDVYIPEADPDYDDDEERQDERGTRMVLGRARLIDVNPWAPRTDGLLFGWGELLRLEREAASARVGRNGGRERGLGGGEVEAEWTDGEWEPEVRLVEHDDPAAANFMAPQYSAHKLPKDVVDASLEGESGVREFAQRWQRITEGLEEVEDSDDDADGMISR